MDFFALPVELHGVWLDETQERKKKESHVISDDSYVVQDFLL